MLNALQQIRYLKPQMPKSWHFVSHGEMRVPMPGDAALRLVERYSRAGQFAGR
ncbi:cell division protein ZapC [Escherichia coli]|nr:cell division protein ZapC [Escherichia coli]